MPPPAPPVTPPLAPFAGSPTIGAAPRAPAKAYVHRFGSMPSYLFARFAACLIDTVGVAFVLATFGFAVFETGFITAAGQSEGGFDMLLAAAAGGALVIAFVCESLFGTTLGKLLFALHVRRTAGGHAGALRVFVRYALRPVDLILIGPLLALVTPRRQRLGDLLAGTVVAGSRFGPLGPVLAIVLFAAIAYAQSAFGGGVTSAIGVAAETTAYAPALYARAANALGIGVPATVRPAPFESTAPRPLPQASDAVLQ